MCDLLAQDHLTPWASVSTFVKQDGLILGWHVAALNAICLCPSTVQADITDELEESHPLRGAVRQPASTNLSSFGSGAKLFASCGEAVLTDHPRGVDARIQAQRRRLAQDLRVSTPVNLQRTWGRKFGWGLMHGTYHTSPTQDPCGPFVRSEAITFLSCLLHRRPSVLWQRSLCLCSFACLPLLVG